MLCKPLKDWLAEHLFFIGRFLALSRVMALMLKIANSTVFLIW
jgi:hypothetical protein